MTDLFPGLGMATNLTDQRNLEWPARFASWSQRSPDVRALCGTRRQVLWRLRPPTIQDARAVVLAAGEHLTTLWPVSRGANWGYGSHLPAEEGAVVLDLSALDAISDLDRESLSVRIEPGVTQAALQTYLAAQAPDLAFNVTGSGLATSVLGNALQRGIGYSGEKDADLYALEVLLADGSLVLPSPERYHKVRAETAGVATDALFFQSNYGIVLAGRLRLRVRQESEQAVVVQGPLEAVIESLREGYRRELIRHPSHVAEPGRSERLGRGLLRALWNREPTAAEIAECFPEQGSYNALFPLYGRKRVVNAVWRELRRGAPGELRFQRVDAARIDFATRWLGRLGAKRQATRLRALRPLLALTWGEPSNVGLTSLDGFKGGDPNQAERGAIYGNAIGLVNAGEASRIAAMVRGKWPDSAFTWIVLNGSAMLTIYTLHFDFADADRAHTANAAIMAVLRAQGNPPYRLGIGARAVAPSPIESALKFALDPHGVLAPGQYGS